MKTEEQLLAENRLLKEQVKSLSSKLEEEQAKIKWYEEQLKLSKQKHFGKSSEQCDGQINLFNEAEAEKDTSAPEPTVEEVVVRKKRSKKRSHKDIYGNLPVETIEYKIDDPTCEKCGSEMHEMSKEVRREMVVIPAQVKIVEHVKYIYACRNCEKNDVETQIVSADSSKALIPKSLVSPSVMAYIMNQKFTNAMPLYRQEQEFKRMGVKLSRQTMANWVIAGAKILKKVYDKMHEELIKQEILHADETPLEVLCEPNRPAITKSYMWLYRTSGDTKHYGDIKTDRDTKKHIILYDYQEGRSGLYAKDFLNGFSGYLHTDGWGGYNRLKEDVELCGCWAHARRKFHEAILVTKNSDPKSPENIGFSYCEQIFELEKEYEKLAPNERKKERQQKSKVVVDAFFEWAKTESEKSEIQKSTLGTALTYAINQEEKLRRFLEDGRIEISNNRAERSIKPFVIGRKNWLFCNTPGGARASSVVYSMIESAKENGLKPYEYLKYVFENKDKDVQELLPWSDGIPECVKLNTEK